MTVSNGSQRNRWKDSGWEEFGSKWGKIAEYYVNGNKTFVVRDVNNYFTA